MLVQEIKCAFAIDRVRAIKPLDLASITHSKLHLTPANLRKFVGNRFVVGNSIVVTTLDHERARGD